MILTLPRLSRNAFEVLSKLPRHGVGSKISRETWGDHSFWAITEVKVDKDGKHGKAFGLWTWKGEPQHENPRRVNGTAKKVWRLLEPATTSKSGQETTKFPTLAATILGKEENEKVAVEETPIAEEGAKTVEPAAVAEEKPSS